MPPEARHSKLGGSVTARNVVVDGRRGVFIEAGAPSSEVAEALGRLIAVRPASIAADPILSPLRRLLLDVSRLEPDAGCDSATDDWGDPSRWVTTAEMSKVEGVSPQAIRARIARGDYLVRQVGRTWLIAIEDEHEEAADAA